MAFRGCVSTGSPVAAAGTLGTGNATTITHPGIAVSGEVMHFLINGAADDNARMLVTNYTSAFEDAAGGTQNNYQTALGNPDGSVCLMYRLVTGLANSTINMTQAAADPFAGVQVALFGPAEGVGGGANGVGTASGTGASTAEASGSAAGVAPASAVGETILSGAGSAPGVGAASAVGEALGGGSVVSGAGAADGVAAAPAVGASTAEAVGASPNAATAPGAGTAVLRGADTSAGLSDAVAAGAATAAAVGNAASTATVLGAGSAALLLEVVGEGVGASAGVTTVTAAGGIAIGGEPQSQPERHNSVQYYDMDDSPKRVALPDRSQVARSI